MSRVDDLLKYANLGGKGIEVAPYFNPAVPKRDGHDVLIVDVFDTQTLRERGEADPRVPSHRITEIEEVDIVGDASRIGDLVRAKGLSGKIDYIVSSHNFEHLPNPIRFLIGVEETLAPGGILSMAVPDYRACFDHFRMPTRLSDWLASYFDDRNQPSPETVFDASANSSVYMKDGQGTVGCFFPSDDPKNFRAHRDLVSAFQLYGERKQSPGPYQDAHCTLVFPRLFELLFEDLRKIGMLKSEIVEISDTKGLEFFIHIRKPETVQQTADEEFYRRRQELLEEVALGLGSAPYFSAIAATRIKDLERRAEGSALSKAQNAELKGEIQRLSDELRLERRARKAAQARLDRLCASTSWRLTAPLRALSRRLRG